MKKLGELAGTSAQTTERLEKGQMKLTKEWAERFAPHLETTPQELMFSDSPQLQVEKMLTKRDMPWRGSIATAKVRGTVGAGVWFESDDLLKVGFSQVSYVPTKFSELTQFAFQCSGPSMDLENIRHGDYVVCVPFEEAKPSPEDGDLVVIERRNGKLVERTVRQVVLSSVGVEFWPRSTDERFREPVILQEIDHPAASDGLSIDIVGLVVGVFSPR